MKKIAAEYSAMDKSTQPPKSPRTVNIFVGFFFLLNLQFGTGYLGVPFAFYHTGLLAGTVTLLAITFIAWNCAIWELEVMARAQAVYERQLQRKEYNEPIAGRVKPNFSIQLDRKFEPTELCEMFLGPSFKYIYLVVLILQGFFACLSFATVAGSALAVNIPFNFTGFIEQCDNNDFLTSFLPTDISCRNAYWISLGIFAIIVVPLSLLELKEQAIVQVTLGIMRFVTIGGIVIFSLVNFAMNDQNRCLMTCDNMWGEMKEDETCTNASSTEEMFTKFDGASFLVAIPVFVFAHACHQSIPGLSHPIKQKKYLRAYLNALYIVSGIVYVLIGMSVSLWFRQCTVETCTLNFAAYLSSDKIFLKIFSYLIVLFPTFVVISAYPLYVVTITNNMQAVVFRSNDSSKTKTVVFVRLLVKFIVAVLPIMVALGLSNLVEVLKFTGLLGFFLVFFPAILQLRSQWVCKKMFATRQPIPEFTKHDINLVEMAEEKSDKEQNFNERDLYMTPYSTIFSHWPVVVVITIIGVILFGMTVASLFVPLF